MVDTKDLNPDFAQRLVQLVAASHGAVTITSGYRDLALQTQLYNQAVQKYGPNQIMVARPGQSNHEKGLAADLGGDMTIAHQLAPQFGLYFPMSWENWHIEPISTATPGHPGNNPAAYTSSPFGDANPTQQDHSSDTAFWAANLTNALTQPATDALGVGGVASDALEVGGSASGAPAVDFSKPPGSQSSVDATAAGVPAASGGAGSVDPKQLYAELKAQGVDPVHAAALVAIAGRESGYSPTAHNGNASTGDNSYGLFQINLINGEHSQFSPEQLSTAQGSITAAAQLVKSGGLQPWGGYRGTPWSQGTNLQAAVDASGGEVTLAQLQGLQS